MSDGVAALMRIIENREGRATAKIYNIGNPANDLSVRELAELMLEIAREFPEYQRGAERVELVEVSSGAYYGQGYQDIQTRVPWIENTKQELDWAPQVPVREALRRIFEAYRGEVATARAQAAAIIRITIATDVAQMTAANVRGWSTSKKARHQIDRSAAPTSEPTPRINDAVRPSSGGHNNKLSGPSA